MAFQEQLDRPRNLQKCNINFTHVIEIHVEDQTLVKRISGRRFHTASGRSYHIDFNPPKNLGFDDISNEPLVQREDDKPDTVLNRLNVYHDQTKPLTEFYSNLSQSQDLKFFKVDGSQTVEEVFESY